MVTTSAGLRSTRRALPSTMLMRSASPSAQDALAGLADQVGHQFHADGARAEMLRGGDDDAAIAASQIVNHLAGLDAAGLQHSIHQELRSRNGRPQILSGPELLGGCGERGRSDDQRSKKDPHALSDGCNGTCGCRLSEL